ncbi:MAG: hypothetical protein ABJD11_08695 [Gemmatimonadota bacterium]
MPISRLTLPGTLLLALASSAAAQSSSAAVVSTARVPPQVAQPVAQQIVAAVLALPEEFRAGAAVLGYGADGKLTEIRSGNGPFICLASDPAGKAFHVACYHRSLEPFMARGRALRISGLKGNQVDSARFAEIKTGRLAMPSQPAALYQLSGPAGSFDAASGTVKGGSAFYVVYIPNATPASTGLPEHPEKGVPWIMEAGTPKAHIMFVPTM